MILLQFCIDGVQRTCVLLNFHTIGILSPPPPPPVTETTLSPPASPWMCHTHIKQLAEILESLDKERHAKAPVQNGMCVSLHMHVCQCASVCMCVHVCMFVPVCVCASVCVCVYLCISVCVCGMCGVCVYWDVDGHQHTF